MKRTRVQKRRARNTTRRRRKKVRGGHLNRFALKTGGPVTHRNDKGEITNANGVPITQGRIPITPEVIAGSSYDNANNHHINGIPR